MLNVRQRAQVASQQHMDPTPEPAGRGGALQQNSARLSWSVTSQKN